MSDQKTTIRVRDGRIFYGEGKYTEKQKWVNLEDYKALMTQLKKAHDDMEVLRMQLAACGVVARCNTPDTYKQNVLDVNSPYYTDSYNAVIGLVQSEMDLREKLDAVVNEKVRNTIDPAADLDRWSKAFSIPSGLLKGLGSP